MAIALEGANSRTTGGAGTSFTLTVACGTNANRCIVVGFAHQIYSGNITSITVNGNAMSSLYSSGTTPRLQMYILAGDAKITTGTNTISVTIDQDRSSAMGAVCFSGVDGTTPNRTAASATGSSNTPAVSSITSVVGETIIGVGCEDSERQPPATYTDHWKLLSGTSVYGYGWGSSKTSVSTSDSLSWTLSGTSAWQVAACSLIPATGAASIIPHVMHHYRQRRI